MGGPERSCLEQEEFKLQEVLEADAHLIGRVTYLQARRPGVVAHLTRLKPLVQAGA